MDLSTDYALTINGQAVRTAEVIDVINPATGKPFAKAPKAGQAELDAAVDAAQSALQGWKALGWEGRRAKAVLRRILQQCANLHCDQAHVHSRGDL